MDATKNDISGDKIKLDYDALYRTSKIAYIILRDNINEKAHKMYTLTTPMMSTKLEAQWLSESANQLRIVAETMDALRAGLTRETIEIINKKV